MSKWQTASITFFFTSSHPVELRGANCLEVWQAQEHRQAECFRGGTTLSKHTTRSTWIVFSLHRCKLLLEGWRHISLSRVIR